MPQPLTCDCLPLPSTSCTTDFPPDPTGCGGIKMFFGALIPENVSKPGQLQKIYSTATDNKFGFAIPNFIPRELINSNLFPGMPSDFKFELNEAELLASATYDGWQQFCRMWSAQTISENPTPEQGPGKPLGSHCMEFLGLDTDDEISIINSLIAVMAGDNSGIKSFVEKLFSPADAPVRDDCPQITAGIKLEKMKIAWEYINNLYKEYYGKQFLVKVSESPGPSGSPSNEGVCVRDDAGLAPGMTKPYFIDGDGSSQGFHSSDEIITAGFPKKGSDTGDLLGVSRLDWIQNENGEVESFVSMGAFSSTTTDPCAEYKNRVIYEKFTLDSTGNKLVKWGIDLSSLNSDSYYIDGNNLFIKCGVDSKLYYDDDGTWAHITLQDRVPLSAIDNNPMLGLYAWVYLLSSQYKGIFWVALNRLAAACGALNNISQLNLLQACQPCLFPEGAVIPFKSNVYHYGPYYYVTTPDNGGGVEVVIDSNIAPWNFMPSTSATVFPVNYPYCMMDNYGKEIAKASVKGVQQLEKGRINVVGLPCYALGTYVDNSPTYNVNTAVGPTLLTDMNVEYGSSGFNTTYNFATYTPRLGKTQKYVIDALSEDIRKRQYINSYLKAEKSKVEKINKGFIKTRLDNNLYFAPPVVTNEKTPGKLLFSGYYFNKASGVPSPTTYAAPTTPSEDLECTASGTVPSSGTPPSGETTNRIYGFAETHEGFTSIHVQNTYYQLAGMSLDGSYLPVSLKGAGAGTISEYTTSAGNVTFTPGWTNAGRLPRFSKRCLFDDTFIEWEIQAGNNIDINTDAGMPIKSKTRDEIPPFKIKTGDKTAYCLPINQRYLNPYLSKMILDGGEAGRAGGTLLGWDERKSDSDKGFVIGSIVFGSDFKNYQVTHTTPEDLADFGIELNGKFADKDTDEFIRQQYCNFRVPAFRGPMVLQGWGYDTTGKPIPNAADTSDHAIMGEFRQGALSDKFMKNWIQNPKTWPVGPIDLRFDRERGVWTCPSPNKIIVARLTEDLKCGGKATAELINPVAGDIHFYEKYHISGPNGENIKTQMFDTEIMVYDFLGLELDKCAKVYVYYDDNRYIVLNSETPELMVRFRAIKLCGSSGEDPDAAYEGAWGAFAGRGDKYSNQHTYGVRIDCDGNPIDINGQKPAVQLTGNFLIAPDNATKWLIKLQDNAGKFGPSYAHFQDTKYQDWIDNGATGYGAKIQSKKCTDSSGSSSSSAQLCTLGNIGDCELEVAYLNNAVLPTYDIIFIESYARFIHGCLTQDLYPSCSGSGSSNYEDDLYKKDHLDGNASVDITHWYGDSPNGKQPIYLDEQYETLPIRVFDPWLKDNDDSEISCYKKNESIFYTASSGTAFTAIFNEKEKKYYLWQINKKESPTIRFKLIDMCYQNGPTDENIKSPNYDTSIGCSGSEPASMDWVKYAGYGDKFPNDHSMGVRINCDGIPVDQKGKILTWQDLIDPNQAECIFVNILDTVGFHGPAFSTLIRQSGGQILLVDFEAWRDKAFTGFATKCDPAAAGNCALGRYNASTPRTTCFPASADYPSYEILFLENYARFVECELTQPLYIENDGDKSCVNDDDYKKDNLKGNASANILGCYGNSPNGKAPIFKDKDFVDVEFRVFDPFMDAPKDKNPFYKLRYGDRVLAIFDESKKKYIIYQSLKYPDDSIVKFALYEDKDVNDAMVSAVLVDACGVPIDIKGQPLTGTNISSEDTIMVNDPFVHRTDYCEKGSTTGDLTAFGPALGSNVLNEHLNGIVLGDGYGAKGVAPFLGFAMKRTVYESESGNCNSINNTGNVVYEMFQLERFAAYVNGKITTKTASYADPNGVNGKFFYLGARPQPQGYTDGICPIARGTKDLPNGDLIVDHTTQQFLGVHSIIIGDIIDNPVSPGGNDFENHDGCHFIAKLDNVRCKKKNGKIEHLIYYIVEAERVALAGVLQFTSQTHADFLNNGFTRLGEGPSEPKTSFGQGFMWDRVRSKKNFDKTGIFNTDAWVKKGMLLANGANSHGSIITLTLGMSSISGNSLNNDARVAADFNNPDNLLVYSVVNAGTIAQVLQKGVGATDPGLFGDATKDVTRKIDPNDTFFHGLSPKDLVDEHIPLIDRIGNQEWMTYEGAGLTALWNETVAVAPDEGKIGKNKYTIVYAQEAPIIITGVANADFTPKDANINITIKENFLPCGMGVGANPMPVILTKVKNPMGYGALANDLVTIQRVWLDTPADGANYKYIIIGTGKPPG